VTLQVITASLQPSPGEELSKGSKGTPTTYQTC
jgi:hypothetical protein